MMIKCNLKVLMAMRDLNQEQLADLAGITRQTIGRYVNNKVTSYDQDILSNLCKVLKCSVGDILEYIPDKAA